MCKRELDAGEPIYRVVVGYRIQWHARFGHRVIGSICEECCGRYPMPGTEIDGASADPTKAFSGAPGRFREAATNVVAWQSDGVNFS